VPPQREGSEADHLDGGAAQDPLGQDHAPAAARHRRGHELGDVTTLGDASVVHQLEAKVQDQEGQLEASEV
jgi:hypothetical protein